MRHDLLRAAAKKRAAGGGGGAWSPANLFANGEKGIWLDMSDFSTMFRDYAGTQPVTGINQAVKMMRDKSGNNVEFRSIWEGYELTVRQNAAGKYYLNSVEGSYNSLRSIADYNLNSDKASIFIGHTLSSGNVAVNYLLEFSPLNVSNAVYSFMTYLSNGVTYSHARGDISNGNQTASKSAMSGNTYLTSTTHDISGDRTTLRRNGVAAADATGDKGIGNFGANRFVFGVNNAITGNSIGEFFGIIVINRIATPSEITSVEAWLNAKMGNPIVLP